MIRVLTQSVDGPSVLLELSDEAQQALSRARAFVHEDPHRLALEGLVVRPPAGFVARSASGLTSDSVAGVVKLFGDPLNEQGPHWLGGYRVTRVHVFAETFWVYAVDDSDPTHLPETNRSDSVRFDELGLQGTAATSTTAR